MMFVKRNAAAGAMLAASMAVGLASEALAQSCAAPGREGPGTLTSVINTYYPGVDGTVAAGSTSVPVGAIDTSSGGQTTAVVAGDLVVVMQVQDADISTGNADTYGDGVAGGGATGAQALNGAGRYEYCVATGPVAAGSMPVSCGGAGGGLLYTYRQQPAVANTDLRRAYQVIRVPQYSSATVTGSLIAARWNGNTGGVIAFDVTGTLTINGSIDVAGRGFRGGGAVDASANYPSNAGIFRAALGSFDAGGTKGEGIAGTPRFVYEPNLSITVDRGVEGYREGDFSRGAPANGGGGGGQHNGGGGGGGNGGAGGLGGNEYNGDSPTLLGAVRGGFGGDDFSNSEAGTYSNSGLLGRVVMGGGGGAGDFNDGLATGDFSSGAPGGGIVLVRAGRVQGSGSITANGFNGRSSDPAASADSGGGGGAGGSIVLYVRDGLLPAGLTVTARGGNGGNNINAAPPDNETDGPGGGGGGGVFLSNASGASVDLAGGQPGVIVGSSNPFNGSSGGAAAGGIGVNLPIGAGDVPGANGGAACLPQITVSKTTSTPLRTQGVDTTATYTITATNAAARGTAFGVSLDDDLPTPFQQDLVGVVPVFAPAACGSGPSPVSSSAADPAVFGTPGGTAANSFTLPASCSVSLTFNVNLNGAANGIYQNPATVRFTDPARTSGGAASAGGNPTVSPGGTLADGSPVGGTGYASASSSAEDVIIGVNGADLSVTQSVAPASANVGGNVVFTVTLLNSGLQAASGVTLRDSLPAGLTYVSSTASQGAYDNTTGSWSVGGLAPGASATLNLTATINPSGSYSNTAEVSASDQSDPDSTPNNGVAGEDDQATATPVVGVADLSLAMTVAPATQNVGSTVAFTLTLANGGPAAASGVAVTDLLPNGYVFLSSTPSQGSYASGSGVWTVGALASGATATLVINAAISATGTYANVAEVSDSDQTDPDSTPANGVVGEDDRATATPVVTGGAAPVIGLAKQAVVTPVSAGVFDVAYTISVLDLVGGSIARDVQVTDNLAAAFPAPATFAIQGAPTTTGGLVANPGFNGTSNLALLNGTADLAGGTPATVAFVVRVTVNGAAGPFNNSAVATAASVDGGPVTTTDTSDNGTAIDANANGNPNEVGENDPTPVVFGGAVSGRVFEDVNGNGVQDAGEPGLAGVQVQVVSGGVTATVTTNATGDWSAANVPAGTVTIDVVNGSLPAGAALTGGADPSTVVVVDGGSVNAGVDGFQRQGTVSIVVFNDGNANGSRDAGENGIPNVQVQVTESDGTVRIVTTAADGTIATGVPVGATVVDIVDSTLPPGATRTAGTDPTTVTVAAAATAVDLNGFQAQGTVAGRVFRDADGDGVLDSGESGIANLPVVITTATGTTINLTTGNDGAFSQVVPAGTTVVRVTAPDGFALTTANNPQNVVVTGGNTVNATGIGYAAFAAVTGSVFRDLDSDRRRDGGEPGVAGWRVELLNPTSGAVLFSALSTETGEYSIGNVVPAQTYRVRYTSPNGAVYGVGVNGENDNPQENSSVNAAQRALEVRPAPGSTLSQQSLPVDPQGIVYDTLTRQPLAGARVAITGPAGFDPATQLLGGAANATQTTGADGGYQFLLLPNAPAGVYTLVLTAPNGYRAPSAFLPPAGTLDPTGQGIGGVLRVQGQSVPPTGAQPTTYHLALDLAPGDPDVVNNHVPMDPPGLQGGAIRLSKRADRPSVSVGGIVAYTITLENTTSTALAALEVRDAPPAGFAYVEGSARLDGVDVSAAVRGPRPLVFSGISLNPGQRRTLRYVLRVGAGVVRGEYPNTASPFFGGVAVGNADTARVQVVADPTFEETTIVGKVFVDEDGDGWQDEGEKGVAGVRLATVEGLVAETDSYGRYHFAAIDGGFMERGRNFIVKLDPATLPKGARVTTENPRVARVTPGLMSRFDFGVQIDTVKTPAKRIDLKLAEIYFRRDSAELESEYLPLLQQLADRIRAGESAKVTVKVTPPSPEGCTPACQLGRRRIDTVRRVLMRMIGPEGLQNVEVVADYTASGGLIGRNLPSPGWLERVAYAALSLLVPTAHAAPCPSDICESQAVEIRAKYPRALDDFGRFWASEDSSSVDPRLAVEGPDRLPVLEGRVDAAANFAIYTNYSAFVERYEVRVFAARDVDRTSPLAVVPVKFLPHTVRNLLVARLDAGTLNVGNEKALQFVVRAYGTEGGVDETVVRRIPLLSRREFDAQSRALGLDPDSAQALGEPAGTPGAATGVATTPLQGRFLVMRPTSQGRLRLLPDTAPAAGAEPATAPAPAPATGPTLALVDPLARTGTDASAGLAAAEASMSAAAPVESLGLARSLPAPFERKRLLADIEGIDDATLQALYGRSDLARRGIAVHGGRVRVSGQDVSPDAAVRLDGQVVPVDRDGTLAYETLLPVGRHELYLDVVPSSGDVWPIPLFVDVTGRQIFMVGLADLTWQKNDISGSVEPLSGDERYLEDSLTEGRLALFLKGKIRGKYLLTTQLDTREEQLGDLVDDIDRKDPRRLFRNIDPDAYYPVYGDDSTTTNEADTQGRLFVKVEWDNSRALLGNFNTSFTGTELSQYNRTLYGANVDWKSLNATGDGNARTEVKAFASEAQTALGHDEFLGTGGSLYYLRHTDVVQGSIKGRVEIVDPLTDRIVETLTLIDGVDYEVDELQGRMVLAKPLMQVARQRVPQLVRDGALDGNRVLLVVDYEYLPLGFQDSAASFGFRGRQWIGEHVAIGGTLVDESRDTQDYRLGGADLTLQPARGTYLRLEYAKTEATQSVRYFSSDGGLSFTALNPLASQAAADNRTGEAYGVEGRMNLRERGLTSRDMTVSAWWKRNDDQFAVARRDEGFAVEKRGVEAIGRLSDTADFVLRANSLERGGFRPGESANVDQLSGQIGWDLTALDRVGAEIRYQSQDSTAIPEEQSTVAALSYRRKLRETWDAYAIAQTRLDQADETRGRDLYTIGTRYELTRRWAVDAEVSSGDAGEGVSSTVEYRVSDRHSLYGTFSHSVDRSDSLLPSVEPDVRSSAFGSNGDFDQNPGNNLALGSRWQLSDQTRIYNETQFSDTDAQAGIGHVFGLDFAPGKGWRYGLTLQRGDFAASEGPIQRNAVSASAGFSGPRLSWTSRLEYRDDSGVTEATQYLTTNRVDWRIRDAWRLLGKLNYSSTTQDVARLNDGRLLFGQDATDAQFAEATIGVAYRPVDNDRFNWLAKLSYLYDLTSYAQASSDAAGEGVTSLEQSGRTDQRSLVASWDGVFRLTPKFDLGGKVARRTGEVRLDRAAGDWIDSTANFAAVRLSYELIRRWDAMVEYRWLDTPDAGSTRQGFLVSIDRELGRNFKVGVGYNFTDFSDDLGNLDYEFRGVFVNVLGKY